MADEITARYEDDRVLPPEAEYSAVCVDVIDLGMVENKTYGKLQQKCAIVFQLDAINPKTGKRFEVAERYTVSMFDKANLRAFLALWRGRSYTDEEAKKGTPLHKLEGQPAVVQIEHKTAANGKTYANVFTIRKVTPADAIIKSEGYVRADFWKKALAPVAVAGNGSGHPDDDPEDEPPF